MIPARARPQKCRTDRAPPVRGPRTGAAIRAWRVWSRTAGHARAPRHSQHIRASSPRPYRIARPRQRRNAQFWTPRRRVIAHRSVVRRLHRSAVRTPMNIPAHSRRIRWIGRGFHRRVAVAPGHGLSTRAAISNVRRISIDERAVPAHERSALAGIHQLLAEPVVGARAAAGVEVHKILNIVQRHPIPVIILNAYAV